MKRLLFAFAVVSALVLSAESARAQAPAPGCAPGPTSAGLMPGPSNYGGTMGYGGYGGHVKYGMGGTGLLSGIFSNHPHGGSRQDKIRNAQMLPVAQGGTLVFPQNPFVRSPRDFFMWDEK